MSEEKSTLPAVQEQVQTRDLSAFANVNAFESAQRMAKLLATSDLVPKQYQGRIENCLIALEVARSTGASIMTVMQNMHLIHGKVSWSSQYVISSINSCGRFSPLRFKTTGQGDQKACVAYATDKNGETLEGPPCSIRMAKDAGWFEKPGSHWKINPDLMLMYRAATFFGRLFAPDVLNGMQTEDEIRDVTPESNESSSKVKNINSRIKGAKIKSSDQTPKDEQSTLPSTEQPEAGLESDPEGIL